MPVIRWDNIVPANVNLLPMQVVINEDVIDRCVERLHGESLLNLSTWQLSFDDTVARQIVLSVLSELAAGDIGLGHEENNQSETGGAASAAPSGSDHD